MLMSCSSGTGIFYASSRLFAKIRRWVLSRMSQSKFSATNGRLPSGCKLRKAREQSQGPNPVGKWHMKVVLLWFLGVAVVSGILASFSSFDWVRGKKELSFDLVRGRSRTVLQHFNVSKKQLRALTSIFSESDQILSLFCTKQSGFHAQLASGFECSAAVQCLDEEDLHERCRWVAEKVYANNQCPVQHSNFFMKLSEDASSSFASQTSILPTQTNYQLPDHRIAPLERSGLSVQGSIFPSLLQMRCEECKREQSESFCVSEGCLWLLLGVILCRTVSCFNLNSWRNHKQKQVQQQPVSHQQQMMLQQKQQNLAQNPPKGAGKWMKTLLIVFIFLGIMTSFWLFWHLNNKIILRREETLANMCDERARMLQDQFNVSMNHVHALAILVSTFHHGKYPSAIDQKTFGEYTERTAFERPLTSGVAYALKVTHSEREKFEKQHGWTIKKMEADDQTLGQDCIPENLDPAPVQDEYAPVIFSQETVSHIVSIDMMSGKEDRENILRARACGKGVLTSPFKLLKSNHLGVVLTFAVYDSELPLDATPEQRVEATVGYLGASYDVPSLVDKLLQQLASKQTIVVDVFDTTNLSAPIKMYGSDVTDTGLLHISHLDFGDPLRKHEMHCRFKQKPPLPWTAINASVGVLVITLLVGHIFDAAISRIAKVENDYREMMKLKARAEAADVAKSQFLATVSHEIRTPMNGVLGMLTMLMDTELDSDQQEYAQTAHESGKDLIYIINEVLDQAKIESGRLELESVSFNLHTILDSVLSIFSGKSNEQQIELAVYVSNLVPEVVIGDPGRFRQIITNLVGNSIKFTPSGHIFVTVHLSDEVTAPLDAMDKVLRSSLSIVQDMSNSSYNTLSGLPVVNRWRSWEQFKKLSRKDATEQHDTIRLLVTVEDTGEGIPLDKQDRIFTPFVQADSSTSRTHGGTGIGLSISKHLVDLMDGEIGFFSNPGIGSTFSFTGSFRKGETSNLDGKLRQYDTAISMFQGLKALVVDNSSMRAEVTRYHLERLGISVDIAFGMESAHLRLAKSHNTSAVTHLSVVLIEKDVWSKEGGRRFCQSLKDHVEKSGNEMPIKTPKIFLLASAISPNERNEIKSAGCICNVLLKPLRLSILLGNFLEALGTGQKRIVNRKKPSTLGNLLKEKRILVVDDNLVNRKVAEGALKKYGAVVTCVGSGQEAISKLTPPHQFDACFMDIQMPHMDGFEATKQIRSMESRVNGQIASGEESVGMSRNAAYWHTPILAMTADVIQSTNEKCVECGMDGYVTKPFEEEQLYSAVARFF